ncbi:MAG TPA: P1 family peptidase, partial [Pseudomonadales bacterium]|nr:P1 family peptidase [Pseudomonadales bacterium]
MAEPTRARDLGINFDGEPGPLNAITDVACVEVGHATVIEGTARTGATSIFPRPKKSIEGVTAATFTFNGTGEMTATHLIKEFGAFFGPIVLTGTLGVGTAHHATSLWTARNFTNPDIRFSRILPVIAETYDGGLSDAWSFPLSTDNVIEALDGARGGPVAEGSVGGGTGMVCHHFKSGIGTASRVVPYGPDKAYTVGVLVQANHGMRDQLTIRGTRVGRKITDLLPTRASDADLDGDGSIIVIVATDAPLVSSQLERLAKRATIGMARTGGQGDSMSGDIFLAFSTANPVVLGSAKPLPAHSIPSEALSPLIGGVSE